MAAARHAAHAPGRAGARHAARGQRAHGLPGRRRATCGRRAGTTPSSATSRATHSAATTTRCCAAGSRASPSASPRHAGTAGYRAFTDSAPVLEKALARDAGLGWIGKHTNLLDRHDGSWFFLGEIYTDLPLPLDAPVTRALRQLHRVHRRLPDAGDRRAVRTRCAPLHLVPDDRASRADPGRIPRGDGQPHLRLRRLPARLPVEPLREVSGGTRLSRAPRPRRAAARRPVPLERGGIPGAHRRQRDPPHRLRALAAQRRRRARQCAARRAEVIAALRSRASDPSELVREHVRWALAQQARRVALDAQANYAVGLDEHPGAAALQVVDQPRLAEPAGREHDEVRRRGRSGRARRSAVRTSK